MSEIPQDTSFLKKCYDEQTKHYSVRDIVAIMFTVTGCAQVLASMFIPGVVIESNFLILWGTIIGFLFNKGDTKPISTPANGTKL